jgi:outer membrane biosynthesis protein TonB
MLTEVSLTEAKVEAAKLSADKGTRYSIIESPTDEGSFDVVEGHPDDAYLVYLGGKKIDPKDKPVAFPPEEDEDTQVKPIKKSIIKSKPETKETMKLQPNLKKKEVAPAKKSAPAKKEVAPAKKAVAKKETPAKKAEGAPKVKNKRIDMPFSTVVELIKEKKTMTRDEVKKFLLKNYSPATAGTQMSRLKNHPNLTVDMDKGTVKWSNK